MFDANEIIDRLIKFFEVKTTKDLAQKVNVNPNTIRNWRFRNTIDISKIFPYCAGINWNWLFTGEGEMRYDAQRDLKRTAEIEYLLRKVNELESQNKLLFKLLEKFVSREEIEKLGPVAVERPREDEIAWIKPVDKTVSVPYLKETPGKAPEMKKETNKL